jgi:hypothetical protein
MNRPGIYAISSSRERLRRLRDAEEGDRAGKADQITPPASPTGVSHE